MSFVDFKAPVFAVAHAGSDTKLMVAGGGGAAKTGVVNSVGFYDVVKDDKKRFSLQHAGSEPTGSDLVTTLTMSASGSLVAASVAGSCALYELHGRNLRHVLTFETDFSTEYPQQNVAVFNGDATRILTGGADGVIRVWRVVAKGAGSRPSSSSSSSSSSQSESKSAPVAATADDAGDGSGAGVGAGAGRCSSAASTSSIVAKGRLQSGRTLEVSLLKVLEGHAKSINDLSFRNQGSLVLSASGDSTFRVWNVTTGKHARVPSIGIHKATSVRGNARRRKVGPGRWEYKACAFSPDGSVLYTLESSQFGAAVLARWSVQASALPSIDTGRQQADERTVMKIGDKVAFGVLRLERWVVVSDCPSATLAVSGRGKKLAVGTSSGEVLLLDATSLTRFFSRKVHVMPVTRLCFVANDRMIASGGADKTCALTPVQDSFDLGCATVLGVILAVVALTVALFSILDSAPASGLPQPL